MDRAPKPLFYFAVFFIVVGVITYEMASTPVVEDDKGHALENAKFRRWRKKAMRLRCRMRRRQGKIQLPPESDDSEGDSSDDERHANKQANSLKSGTDAEGRVIV